MNTLDYYLERAIRSANRADTIIDLIEIDVITDIEIGILKKAGYLNSKNIDQALSRKENNHSIAGMFSVLGENGSKSTLDKDTQEKLYDVSSPFSEMKIKRAISKLEKKGVLKKVGASENQIRLGNYYIELI